MGTNLNDATIFYSWQSDLDGKTTRSLIEGCLNTAIRQLGRDDDLDVTSSLDRDTKGITGSPNIFEAILEKIDNCVAFVADISIINSRDIDGPTSARPTPNPNVLIELGYAIKKCGWDCVLPVSNDHYAEIGRLPFDIPERRVISYTLSDNPSADEIKAAKEKLTAIFKSRLKEILKRKRVVGLDIQLGAADTEELYGHEKHCQLYKCEISDYQNEQLPDHERYLPSYGAGPQLRDTSCNRDYYRDVAQFARTRNTTQQFAFAIKNGSDQTLKSPRLEVVIETHGFNLAAFDIESFPEEPQESKFASLNIPAMLKKQKRGNVAKLKKTNDRTLIRADLEDIQAKRTVWTTCCFLGTDNSDQEITLHCKLHAENLSQPFEQILKLNFTVGMQSKTLYQWIEDGFLATLIAVQQTVPAGDER